MREKTYLLAAISTALFFLNLWPPLFALNPDKKISQYIHDAWGTKQGLPHNTVIDILQTTDGYLWLTTEEGLVRFDGVKFEVFDKQRVPQFVSNSVWFLFQDSKGLLRIGTNGSGLVSLDLNSYTFSSITREKGLPHNTVNSICETPDGTIWLGTEAGLALLKNGETSLYPQNDLATAQIRFIYATGNGHLWVVAGESLQRLDLKTGDSTVYTTEDGLNHNRINTIYQDKRGRVWIGSSRGLNRWNNGKFSSMKLERKGKEPSVWNIEEDRDGNLWLATYGMGLYRIDGRRIDTFTRTGGLDDDYVWTLYEDREGSIWIGTNSTGLQRLRDGKFTSYTRREGLSDDIIWSVFEDSRGILWLGTDSGGLIRMANQKDEEISAYTTKQGLPHNRVWTIRQEGEKTLWLGTDSGGLTRVTLDAEARPKAFTSYNIKDGLNNNRLSDILVDGDQIWLATYGGGVNRFKDGKFTAYTREHGLLENDIICLLKDKRGYLWIGTEGSGLNRLKITETGENTANSIHIDSFTKSEGLRGEYILSLYEDTDGAIWIGTYSGLNRYKNGSFRNITKRDGLFDDIAYVILDDGLGYFWMSCNRGVYRAAKKDLDDFCDGKIQHVPCANFDDHDGMVSRECYGTSQPAGWKTRDGHLWFPTAKGAVEINPAKLKTNTFPPPVKIEYLRVDEKQIPLVPAIPGGHPALGPGVERIEIHYTALSFPVPERVHFRCKLEPFDTQWHDMQARRTAYYTQLSPGNYTFRVKAHNDDGVWNEKGSSVSFYLKPFFHQTGWFKILAGFIVLSLIFTALRLRLGSLTRRKTMLEQLVKKRTMELQLSNKELEKLSIVARETDNAVMLMDSQGNLEWINEGATRMYGFTFDQLVEERGKNITQVSSYPGIDKLLRDFLAKPEPVRYESHYHTRQGEAIWTQITWTPVFGPDRSLSQIVAISSNITKIKQSEERIKAQAADLQKAIIIARQKQKAADAANQAKNEFLARMSHELRTPMNGIVGFIEMLMDTKLDDTQRDFAETINRCGQGLSVLLNDILDFSRVEAGELNMVSEEFSPAEVIEDVCRIISPRLKDKPVEITCQLTMTPDRLTGDVGRFRQVLINLAGNAAKFTYKGRIEVSMQIERETAEDLMLHIQVQDTGIGIPKDKQDKIFDAFFQLDSYETRQYEGSGLGLAISRQIARLMQGDIWVESETGKGSTFHFTAWMQKPAPPEPPAEENVTATFYANDIDILVAEDNAVNQKLLKHLLTKAGFRFNLVKDGREAVDAFNDSKRNYDLILMDIQMPVMTGLEATRKIRETDQAIPIIAITAQAMKGDRQRCLEAGMNDYIPKPIKQDEVFAKIYQWAER